MKTIMSISFIISGYQNIKSGGLHTQKYELLYWQFQMKHTSQIVWINVRGEIFCQPIAYDELPTWKTIQSEV
jgi:hypothetical protein